MQNQWSPPLLPGNLTWNLIITQLQKENHLNQTSILRFELLIFQGVTLKTVQNSSAPLGLPPIPMVIFPPTFAAWSAIAITILDSGTLLRSGKNPLNFSESIRFFLEHFKL